jgi:SAM-dependent methyltransferase
VTESDLPADLSVRETFAFVREVLPPRGRVLDVGCGRGALAERLGSLGLDVIALDRDAEAVRQTRERGVETVESGFLDYHGGPFDAVLFARSLHHLDPLDDALDQARRLLAPGGRIVAEEFAIESMDRGTARWFFDLRSVVEAAGLMAVDEAAGPADGDPLERWFAAHAAVRPLHTGAEMRAGLARRFERVEKRSAPYLYRVFADRIDQDPRGLSVAARILELERRGIAEGLLVPLGLRMVARSPAGP